MHKYTSSYVQLYILKHPSIQWNIYNSFHLLDQKALEDLSDMFPQLKRPNHLRRRNIRTTFSWQQSTATPVHSSILVVPTRWNSNKFEKYKISSEHIVQIDSQYNVYDTFLNLIWYNTIIFPHDMTSLLLCCSRDCSFNFYTPKR